MKMSVNSTIGGARADRATIDLFPFGLTTSLVDPAQRLLDNYTNNASLTSEIPRRDALYIVVPITVIYVLIFFTGLVGNVSTCVVIARNRSMHTATNYYLFSLAISDLLLISGLPTEMYYIWSHHPYAFGEMFCIIQSFAAETSANATVLTITAFTVERYVAICHPFISHTMSKLSRAVKYVILIWLLALCLAIPQAIQFGIAYKVDENGTFDPDSAECTRKWSTMNHAFEISTILFFVAPMSIIIVLYVLIGVKLRRSRILTGTRRNPIPSSMNHSEYGRGRSSAQRNVIRMLVAVVVAFFICWAPFHAQRLMAVYAPNVGAESQATIIMVYRILTYVSGVFYYLSTTVNPLLYNIMSNKFREAFKSMLAEHCGGRKSLERTCPRRPTYSSLSRNGRSTVKREAERNSLSASEENPRHTVVAHNDAGHGRAVRNFEISPILTDRSRLNFVSRNNDEASKKCEQLNGRMNGDKSNTPSSGASNQMANPLVRADGKNLNRPSVHNCLRKNQRPPLKSVTLGLIAERLRFGTKSLFASQHQRPHSQENQILQQQPSRQRAVNSRTEIAGRINPKFQSHPCLESANTISNSSLQDLDETEFTGVELSRYMGELNFDLDTRRVTRI